MTSSLQGAIRGPVHRRGAPGFERAARVFNPRLCRVPMSRETFNARSEYVTKPLAWVGQAWSSPFSPAIGR
jgi:hypothetical protein